VAAVGREGTTEQVSAVKSDRAAFEAHQASSAANPTVPVERPRREERKPRTDGPKKLSDRELFELLQAGKPLPVVEDPTADAGSAPHDEAPRERGERRERRERRPRREDAAPVEVAPGLTRLWLNLGKIDKVADESALVSMLETLGAPAGKVAKTELRGSFSYVHVAEADADAFEALAGKQANEKSLKIERARR
jgi:hypothetical protein